VNHIGLVVEGRADRTITGLVRRYLAERCYTGIGVGRPICAKDKGKLLKKGELEKFVHFAATEEGAIAVLVLFDSDKDRACELGPAALARVKDRISVPVRICIAIRNIENWIVASAETTLGGGTPIGDPEGPGSISAVKEFLKPRAYNKPIYQPGLTERIDFDLARRRCPSFNRFLEILDEIASSASP
jgi:Domain of unknown function (DUF4276)